jgi:transposase InsO family protein
VPPELQRQVQAEVERTKARSGWSARRTLAALGISRGTYYRWLKEEAWARESKDKVRPVQPFEALPEERAAVLGYARRHAAIRHRELAWRMVDEDVAFLSPSTVYWILREGELMCRQRGRQKRYREEIEKATRPDQRWGTDLMYLKVHGVTYYYLGFIDEYSRYIVHWELLSSMDGNSVSVGGQAALETLPHDGAGQLLVKPEIRSDNGSCYISQEFHGVLDHYDLMHVKIKPHCPEENGIMERSNRTVREAWDETGLESDPQANRYQAEEALGRIIDWYNTERLHSSLGFLRPIDYYRGQPAALHEARRRKLAAARHRRREKNLELRQPTLPLEGCPTCN